MTTDFTMITVDDGQGTTELHNAAQCAAAVAAGSVKPDTPVVVYSGSKQKAMRAGDVPVFAALFAPPPAPSTPAPVAPPAPVKPPETSKPKTVGPWTTAEAYDEAKTAKSADKVTAASGETKAQTAAATPMPTPKPTPTSTEPPVIIKKPDHSTRNAGIAVAVVLMLGFCASVVNKQPSTPSSSTADSTKDAAAAAEETVDPEANLPVVSYYVRRPTNVQLQAGPGKGLAKLDRGTLVSGVVVPGKPEWLHLRSGDYAGRYVWLVNLTPDAPLELDRSMNGERTAWATDSIRVAPRNDAALVAGNSDVVSGRKFDVAGLVGGGWAEVRLEKGGVGYVPASVFDEPAVVPAATATETAADETTAGTSDLHQVFLNNQCAGSTLKVAIMYHNADGWQVNGGEEWTLRGNQSFYPTYGSRRLLTDSNKIYYSITAVDGRTATQGSPTGYYNYGSRRLGMRLAKLTATDNNDYRIDLGC